MPVVVLALSFSACGGGTSDGGGPAAFTLSVQKLGSGSGTVSGGAISCGATCSASLDLGASVTLTSTAAAGSAFAGWSGCDSTSGATCSVTMNADRTVTATFDLATTFGSLGVVNGTSYTTTQLYVSPAGANTWGANRLATPIGPGGTFTLADIPVGTYDFRAVASDGFSYWQTNAVSITDGGLVTWTLAPPDLGSLSAVNNHCIAVDELYVRPASSPTWSPNQLASPVAPGSTFTLAALPVGTYDVSAMGLDGNSWTINGIDITAGGTTWPLYMPAGTGCLTVVNNAELGASVEYLYAPPSPEGCTGNAWGAELLAGQPIPPDTSFTISNITQGPHDLWARNLTTGEEHRVCAASIPAGGTFVWYFVLP